jgi:peptide/nickel transport system permease protein
VLASLRTQLGIDKPWPQQYWDWISGVLRGDWGTSFTTEEPVFSELMRRLPVTLELAIGTTIISLLIAIPVGVISATRQDTPIDYIARVTSIGGLSMPGFWLGTLLIVFPAIWWGYLPPLSYVPLLEDPWANFRQFIFPCLAMGAAFSATAARMTRSTMLEVLRQDYIRTAFAKGLRERRVVYQHALKNAMIPVVTIVGIDFGYLLGRTVIIESVFALPGIGSLTLRSIFQRDYPQIQGNVLFIAVAFVLINLLVDVLYAWLDPRIRYS